MILNFYNINIDQKYLMSSIRISAKKNPRSSHSNQRLPNIQTITPYESEKRADSRQMELKRPFNLRTTNASIPKYDP